MSLLNLLKGLNRNIFYPVVIVPSFQGPLVDRLKDLNIEFKVTDVSEFSRYRPFSFLSSVIRLVWLIKKEKINLVHTNSIYSAEQGFFASKLAGIPCVCHIRDLVPVLGAGKIRTIAFKKAQKIIAISDAVRKDLTEKLNIPSEKIMRIYNGVDTQEFSPSIRGEVFRREFNLGQKKLIGMIGRLSPEKGHEVFLKAAAPIVKDKDDVQLVICGSADLGSSGYRQGLAVLAGRLGIDDKVVFTGFRRDAAAVMAALDIVVVPSEAEPFGRVIIEAMAAGKPVIASDSGAVPEVLSRGCGILVKPGDITAFGRAIKDLVADEQMCRALGEAARDAVLEKFDIRKNVSETEQLYRQVLDAASGYAKALRL